MPASMEWKSLGLVLLGVVLGYMLGRSPPQHDAFAGRFPGKVFCSSGTYILFTRPTEPSAVGCSGGGR